MKIDVFGVGLSIILTLWIGKELDLLPFIYGAQPCTPSITEIAK